MSFRPWFEAQLETKLTALIRRVWTEVVLTGWPTTRSSVYIRKVDTSLEHSLLVKSVKREGDKTAHCGTPQLLGRGKEARVSSLTIGCDPKKLLCSHEGSQLGVSELAKWVRSRPLGIALKAE